jgi:hypothetical protein
MITIGFGLIARPEGSPTGERRCGLQSAHHYALGFTVTELDAGPAPMLLTALIRTLYEVPFVNPAMTNGELA